MDQQVANYRLSAQSLTLFFVKKMQPFSLACFFVIFPLVKNELMLT